MPAELKTAYLDNDAKRIVTKSGNRIQMVDQPGKPSLSLATPDKRG